MPIEILMPALSPTMSEGTLAKWLKKEGDTVSAGDVIAEIETDKATMEVEAVDEGTMGKILVQGGTENVPVNKVIALLLEEGEDKKALDSYKPAEPEEAAEEDAAQDGKAEDSKGDKATPKAVPTSGGIAPVATKAPTPPAASRTSGNRTKISPLAKRLAEEQGLAPERVVGTGPGGRIVKADIEDALARGGSTGLVTRDAGEFTTETHSGMRKTIAKRLLESKQQVPHFYLTVDCELDALLEVRKQLNDRAEQAAGKDQKPAYKLSVNDFIVKASALALRDVPDANTSWYDDAMVRYSNVDISVAVATEGGLITPVVKNADQKSLPYISNEVKDLAGRARANKLKPEEYQGGGFSISNLGMYGIRDFAAIINPPQSCILAVGKGEERAIVKQGELCIANVMTVTLSVDHRAVDGAVGAMFLDAFKRYIEAPVTMFV